MMTLGDHLREWLKDIEKTKVPPKSCAHEYEYPVFNCVHCGEEMPPLAIEQSAYGGKV